MSITEQDADEPIVGGHTDLMDLDAVHANTGGEGYTDRESMDLQLTASIAHAEERADHFKLEAKRWAGIAKATRAALNILREGDNS